MVSSSTIKHQPSTSTPIPISCATNTLFIFCSAYIGQHSVGTPAATAYSTEFHPQCLTRTCRPPCAGARPPAAPRTQRRGPGPWSSPGNPPAEPAVGRLVLWGLNDRRNLCPDTSRPVAISRSCSSRWTPALPKQRYTTLRSGCPSSHDRHSCLPDVVLCFLAPGASTNYPTQNTGGTARPPAGKPGSLRARAARGSNDSNVSTRMPSSSPPAQSGVVDVALQALAHLPAEVRRRDGRDPEELEGSVPKLSKACWDVSGHVRELEVDGESGSAGGVEGVGRHAELAVDVEGVEGEHVDDEGVHAPEREGAEEAAEAPVAEGGSATGGSLRNETEGWEETTWSTAAARPGGLLGWSMNTTVTAWPCSRRTLASSIR
ncbi:hypothetical protein SETIT_2G250700v2 [Setaria italica]|uniref:Uncharacterized protein n=1 Tax=Setaria italica TaxID=4555 RepID=A0A368Q2Y0_SETIT|nr:hypothetical protein SETIT_2G250700v2 [Setaria italica]